MSGGSNNSAQKAAEASERERQAKIQQSIGAINGVYSSPERESQYGDFLSATRDYYNQDLDKQKVTADRNAKFALARGGLTGGSAAVDMGKDIGEGYTKGLLEADRKAQGAAADLRQQDQASKMNLIQLAQGGLDATTGAQQAAASMRADLASGNAARTAGGLGDFFGNIADVNKASTEAKIRRQGYSDYGQSFYTPLYGGGP